MNAVERFALANVVTKRRGFAFAPVVFPSADGAPARWREWLETARKMLSPALLLLVWDVDGLRAVTASRRGGAWTFSEEAVSKRVDFGPALDDVLARLRTATGRTPRTCYLAARFIAPARVDLPVKPEKPRPPLQMRELARAEMEAAVAEAGALWTIGAVLAARGMISGEQRERIVLELALRREQPVGSGPTYFGQVAYELGIVGKEDLQETLRLQEKLQTLESSLACGWTGFAGEPGEPPVWLASATGLGLWSQFETACKQRGIKLMGGLPLAWSVSEAAAAPAPQAAGEEEGWRDESRHSRIALEIHAEEVTAVLRHRGRIVSARSEGRMERALAVDWLLRLVADWRASGVNALEIVCLGAADEKALETLRDDFVRQWGRAPQFTGASAARLGLLETLARQHKARTPTLPVIRFGEPARPLWKRVGFWHLALPLAVVAVAAALHVQQRAQIKAIQARFDLADLQSRREANIKQQEAGVLLAAKREKEELDAARRELTKLMPEVERMRDIEGMTTHLPQLLRTLARNIDDDVVLEVVRNSQSGGGIGDIMIVGWTNHYGSGQAFAQRVQRALAGLGYAVAQTDVRAGVGRGKKPGYYVSFWLIPRAADELGVEAEARDGEAEAASPALPEGAQ